MTTLSNWEESRNESPEYWADDAPTCRVCEEVEDYCGCKKFQPEADKND